MTKSDIQKIMTVLTTGIPLENCGEKLENYSIRKIAVKKLKTATVPESSFVKVIGHTSTRGFKSHDLGDRNEFRGKSNALKLSGANQSTSLSLQNASK